MKEKHYTRCLVHALGNAGHLADADHSIDVEFEGLLIPGALEPDLIVDRRVVVELKASSAPIEVHDAQLLSYLQHSGLTLGYVLNFRVPLMREGIRRSVNTPFAETS